MSIAEWGVKRQGEKNCGLRSVDCGVGSEEAVKGIADCGVEIADGQWGSRSGE